MKTKNIILAIIFSGLGLITNAQPLPPTTPGGNPVPAEGLFALLPLVLLAFGLFKLKNKEK